MLCYKKLLDKYLPSWLEIDWGWNFAYEVSAIDDHFSLEVSLFIITLYIKLPINASFYMSRDYSRGYSWGICYFHNTLWFRWNKKALALHMPWSWIHVRHSIMYPDGLREAPEKPWETDDGRILETHPYKYILRNGKVQERTATCYISEQEWRWRAFSWLPWPRKICRCIDVQFNDEVGERSGSWKGGTMGCGYEMKPGEKIIDTLRRMEKERVFN